MSSVKNSKQKIIFKTQYQYDTGKDTWFFILIFFILGIIALFYDIFFVEESINDKILISGSLLVLDLLLFFMIIIGWRIWKFELTLYNDEYQLKRWKKLIFRSPYLIKRVKYKKIKKVKLCQNQIVVYTTLKEERPEYNHDVFSLINITGLPGKKINILIEKFKEVGFTVEINSKNR